MEIILSITGLTTGNISWCFEKSLFNSSALSKSILYAPDNTKEKCVPPVASSKTFTTFSFFTIDIPVVPPPRSTQLHYQDLIIYLQLLARLKLFLL